MKKCEDFQEMISSYIDDELSDYESSKIFSHLSECQECRTTLTLMMRLHSSLLEGEYAYPKKQLREMFWRRKFAITYPVAAIIVMTIFMSTILFYLKITQPPTIVEKLQTEYVYMTAFPPVYAKINSSANFKSN